MPQSKKYKKHCQIQKYIKKKKLGLIKLGENIQNSKQNAGKVYIIIIINTRIYFDIIFNL